MAEIINISSINPITFEFQEYSTSDTSLITFLETQSSFDPKTDTVEFFVYDLNNQIVYENVSNFYGYNLDSDNNVLTLDPGADLINYGFTEGQYNTVYNFLSPKLASDSFNTYYISEQEEGVKKNVLNIVNTIASEGIVYRETGDYGMQPDFYVRINIGEFNKHYIHN